MKTRIRTPDSRLVCTENSSLPTSSQLCLPALSALLSGPVFGLGPFKQLFHVVWETLRLRDAVFASEFAHPSEVIEPLLHGEIEVDPGHFFSESADMEFTLEFAQAGELFPGPGRHQSQRRSHAKYIKCFRTFGNH
jgi:hypothetical protein